MAYVVPVSNPVEEYRPPSQWPLIRTVCHGCRTIETVTEQLGAEQYRSHKVIHAGDGIVRRVGSAANERGEMIVERACPVCGNSDTPGWIDGFVPPA